MPVTPFAPAPALAMELLPGPRHGTPAFQLNPLWERVVRTQRLPAEVDLQEVLGALRHRLRDPEREVRQHALRVLADLVPVLRSSLDSLLAPLLPDLLCNLGHSAPAVRKGALDALRMYISYSDNKEYVISEICTRCLEKNSINDKFQEDVTMGVILALPSLLQPSLGFLGSSSEAIISVIKALSSKLFQVVYQEVAIRSLIKLRELIGKKIFEDHMESLDSSVSENFSLLCNVYNLSGTPNKEEKAVTRDHPQVRHDNEQDGEKSAEMFYSEQPEELLDAPHDGLKNHSSITVDMDDSESIPSGKVILETEFAFDSDTAITMTILEEDENVANAIVESEEEESYDYQKYNKSLVKVFTDSEIDEYEDVRRTPRRVRFGGEIVKMRTPDSETIQNSDADDTAEENSKSSTTEESPDVSEVHGARTRRAIEGDTNITTERDGTLRKTRIYRSMIPLPTEPKTTIPKHRKYSPAEPLNPTKKRKSKSLNDLSEYCKQHFGVIPSSRDSNSTHNIDEDDCNLNVITEPIRKLSHDPDILNTYRDQQNEVLRIQRSPLVSPPRYNEKFSAPPTGEVVYSQEDDLSGQSGSGSTGSGSSSDNALEDTLEELNVFDDDIFKDLYKMEGQRGALLTLERLTSRLSEPGLAGALTAQQVRALATRLGALSSRARGRAGEAGARALGALLRTARPAALRAALPALAGAAAAQGPRAPALLADLGRRLPAQELLEALLDEDSPHWRSTKLRAGALRAVAQTARTLPCAGVRVQWACARCAACARNPRRRVRAAALDALAALARLSSPRAVLAAVHQEAADHEDGDRLYDAVLARLCRPAVGPGAGVGAGAGSDSGGRRPDLAWVMAGRGDAEPPTEHKYSQERHQPPSIVENPFRPAPSHGETSRPPPTADPRLLRQGNHDWEIGAHRMSEARVFTAPPLALRPLGALPGPMNPGPPSSWAPQTVLWSNHHQGPPPDVSWPHNKQGSWPPLGGSWPQAQGGQQGGSWPARRPPSLLRALSPPAQAGHAPLPGPPRWGATQGSGEDRFSPHSPLGTGGLLGATRPGGEGSLSRAPMPQPSSPNAYYRMHNKIDENGDIPSHKSDFDSVRDADKSPTGSTASLPAPAAVSTPSTRSRTTLGSASIPSPHLLGPQHNYRDASSSPLRVVQEPIPTGADFEDDEEILLPSPEPIRSKPSSLNEERFMNNAQDIHTVDIEDENEPYDNEERFINLKQDSPSKDMVDRASISSKTLSTKERLSKGSAHSVKSEGFPVSTLNARETPDRAAVVSAPAISFLGSSVSLEDDVKSVESALSEVSIKGSIKSLTSEETEKPNGEINGHAISVSKLSPIKKTPKKVAKVIPKALSSKFSKNKVQPIQNSTTSQPFEKPKDALSKSLAQIEHADWETVMTGLQTMESLVKFHTVFLEPHLTPVTRAIACQVKNLRSQVARSACRLAGNLFVAQKKNLESEAEELAVPLLHRTADTNKFLRSDANEALNKMCDSISTQKAICIIMTRGAVHQNAVVRCTSARLLSTIANNSGPEKIFSMHKEIRDKLFQTGADLLAEGSLDTRGHAKQLFRVLSQNTTFLRTLRDVIPLSKYRNIEKALINIRSQ